MGHRVTKPKNLKVHDGVAYNPEREQPYTVWINNNVVGFFYSEEVAYKTYLIEKEKNRLEVRTIC